MSISRLQISRTGRTIQHVTGRIAKSNEMILRKSKFSNAGNTMWSGLGIRENQNLTARRWQEYLRSVETSSVFWFPESFHRVHAHLTERQTALRAAHSNNFHPPARKVWVRSTCTRTLENGDKAESSASHSPGVSSREQQVVGYCAPCWSWDMVKNQFVGWKVGIATACESCRHWVEDGQDRRTSLSLGPSYRLWQFSRLGPRWARSICEINQGKNKRN